MSRQPTTRPFFFVRCLFVLSGVLLVSGCTSGGDAGPSSTSPDSTADASAGGTDTAADATDEAAAPDADDFNRLVDARSDLVSPGPARILAVDSVGDDRLLVSFEMESHLCHGADTQVAETDNEVVVGVVIGELPDTGAEPCTYGVYPYTTEIELDAPLGTRTLATAEIPEPAEPAGAPDAGEPLEPVGPGGIDPVLLADGAEYVGAQAEDGVEWAIGNNLGWRVESDEEPLLVESDPTDPTVTFVVEGGVIVDVQWP